MANEAKGIGRLLSTDQITKIKKSREEIGNVKATMQVLKRMGMDIKPIEEKIDWIEKIQDIMLEEYKKV